MAKRLTQALGVDIGTQSIKIASVKLGRDGAVIAGLGKAPTPDNAIDHTGIYDPAALGAALKSLIAESGVGVRDVIFGIAGQSAVVVRNLEVPRMSDKELAEHMQWEIQRNIPFAESTIVSDYRPVENPALDATQNMEVVMAVSPQSAIEMIVELVRAAGCRAAAIDVEPLALGRVLKVCHAADLGAKRVCLVDIGHMTTAINMYREGVLAFPRTVPMGGSQFSKAISDTLSIPIEEAEARKISELNVAAPAVSDTTAMYTAPATDDYQPYNPFGEGGAPEGEPGSEAVAEPASTYVPPAAVPTSVTPTSQISNAVQNQLSDFAAELRRSIDYFRSRGGDVDEIALAGGGAALPGMGEYLSSSLGLPASIVNPLQGVAVDLPGETYTAASASEFAVAVGMGLHIAFD